jgi:two-component system OmpR family response regulator
LVDDDVEIGNLLVRYLKKFNITCLAVTDGMAMRQHLAVTQVDIILLDLMLPGEDGLSLLRGLRSSMASKYIPILMLTARGEFADKITGLEMGADDYVVKPFDTRELVARIHTVLRRSNAQRQTHQAHPKKEIIFNQRRLNCHSRELTTSQNTVIPLSNAEFRLLIAFIERPSQILSRDQLLDIVRGKSTDVFDRSIDLLVSRLRQKLDDDPRHPTLLKTVRGEGYVFSVQI